MLTALVEAEDKYISEIKQSRCEIIEQTDSNAEDFRSLQTHRNVHHAKSSTARDSLKLAIETEDAKFSAEKSTAVQQILATAGRVSDSVEKIREQSETFVNLGKDAWNGHYADTEASVRQKSDGTSAHVAQLHDKTKLFKVIFLHFYIWTLFGLVIFWWFGRLR